MTAVSVALGGCNGLPPSTASSTGPAFPTYMSPVVNGTSPGTSSPVSTPNGPVTIYHSATAQPGTYTIDDTAATYSLQTTSFGTGTSAGITTNNAGTFFVLARNLRSLSSNYQYSYFNNSSAMYNPSLGGNYAIELAGQEGGFVQLLGEAATPIADTQACPSFSNAQTFQFITLPSSGWDSTKQAAFGSVQVSTSGENVSLSNIQQFTLPVSGGATGTPANTYAATASGLCSSTPYGNTVSIPAGVTISNPGGGQNVAPSAILGVGPSGFLVESYFSTASNITPNLPFGSGTGAVGIPQPSSAVDTNALLKAQYLGFVYSSGSGWSSTLASFGFPGLPADCSNLAPQTSTLIYGGDFPINSMTGAPDPGNSAVQANGGFPLAGYCDLAIDLGPQSAASNGLFPAAKVWMGSNFVSNTSKTTHSFPAVAVAGQLQGKFALLLIGEDASANQRPWAIYLMQSN